VSVPTLNPATKRTLHEVSTATVTTQLLSRGLRNAFLHGVSALRPGQAKLIGPAFTLRYIPAREDVDVLSVFADYDHPQRRAVETVPAGSVLVMDCRRQTRAASFGDILATRLQVRGAAGVVTDGALRDSGAISELTLPVYCAAASPTTNLAQHHAVDLQVPIGCAEVAIYPGDIIFGDQDGVVCIPAELVDEVAADALEQEHVERFVLSKVAGGAPLRGTYPPDAGTRVQYQEWAVLNPIIGR
jgi:regulator of RNase E activity RraA